MRSASRAVFRLAVVVLLLAGVIWGNFVSIPLRNTSAEHFDALLVLGSPTNPDGAPSPEQRTRVAAAVDEYRAGRAPVLIVSGGAAHNRYVEAETMAKLATDAGVPSNAVIKEKHAGNTVQNIWYGVAMLQQRGLHSVEVVSSPSHLPRAALILRHYPGLVWATSSSHWPPQFLRGRIATIYCLEMLECLRLRLFGFSKSPYLPA